MDIPAVIKLFKKQRIVTVALLTTWLSCSMPTARRRLKEWKAYTSYNHNGRYYTLPGITEFDEHGLWRYRGRVFLPTRQSEADRCASDYRLGTRLEQFRTGRVTEAATPVISVPLSHPSGALPGKAHGAVGLVCRRSRGSRTAKANPAGPSCC